MNNSKRSKYIKGLQVALRKERASQRVYHALAERETNEARRKALLGLAETENGHADRWATRLRELNAELPPDNDPIGERIWRWVLVQSGTDNALKRVEENEVDDNAMYAGLAEIAPTEEDKKTILAVKRDEEIHRGGLQSTPPATQGNQLNPQDRLDMILHRETWHRHGGGWIGQAIYGANDGLGSVFGIVSGVAGATAGGPAVLIAGLAGMLASALSMGSGAYLATKADREMQEAELRREGQEIEQHPDEERDELALFYQLKGMPEEESKELAAHLITQPQAALQTLGSEELGITEQAFANPWLAAVSASLSTASGAFIPIIPFFFTHGYPAIIASFAISTLSHFLIGAAKTVVTGLSPLRSGAEMTVIGLGEAVITYSLGRVFGPLA